MNRLGRTAVLVRDHYMEHFRNEYERLIEENAEKYSEDEQETGSFLVLSDLESNPVRRRVRSVDIKYKLPFRRTNHFRHDFVTMHSNKTRETHLCWPVLDNYTKDTLDDDIPWFTPYSIRIKNTEVVVSPFAWHHCIFVVCPNAEPIKGILDAWFYKWYFRKEIPDPFLGVIHELSGPHHEQEEGELYSVDLGTAPVEAFMGLIYNLCRDGVRRIEIR